jgi:hypothetical protein
MESTIQFLTELQTQRSCCESNWRTKELEINKIDGIPVQVKITYFIRKNHYDVNIDTDDEMMSKQMYFKRYNILTEDYTIREFAIELKNDFTKMRFSKLEDKFYTEPIEENLLTTATNFLCSDNSLISSQNSINECGVCFEKTKKKLFCCNNILCRDCQVKIKKKCFEDCEVTPCPFCRKVINTEYTFDEDED